MKTYSLFRSANVLYKHAFGIYYPLYCLYKKIKERDEYALMRRSIKPGHTVIDIGANIGVFTRFMATLTGNGGVVHAFEPDLRNFRLLANVTRKFSNAKLHYGAIGERDGITNLYLSDDLNVDHRTYRVDENRAIKQVPCFSLDSFINGPVDYIKMDIQGYEFHALRGMKETLIRNPRCLLLMELWPYGLQKAGSSTRRVIEFLHECGYTSRLLLKGTLIPFSEGLVQCHEKKYYTLFASKKSA
jgi:FkbM family methyltransferase